MLVKAAEPQGASTQAMAALFSAAYEEGRNISDLAVLEQVSWRTETSLYA